MTAHRRRIIHAGWLSLCEAILRGAPKLDGALCVGQDRLFDAADRERTRQAAAVCQRCPALAECRAWAKTLPRSTRPPGVLAGRLHGPVDEVDR